MGALLRRCWRIARALLRLQNMGWLSMNDWSDYVLWSPREFNTVADHVANVTMDLKRSWTEPCRNLLQEAQHNNSSWRLCIDGGRRGEHIGALGVALYACKLSPVGSCQYSLVARKGVFLDEVASAFLAEALALECGLEYLLEVLEGKIT